MHPPTRLLTSLTLSLLLLLHFSSFAEPLTPEPSFESVLEEGHALERAGLWSRAIQKYEEAAKSHPNSALLRERIRLCEVHFDIGRRYKDASFKNKLLRVPAPKAITILDEINDKIEAYYVDKPDINKQFRSGLDQLSIALRDSEFKEHYKQVGDQDRVSKFLEYLRSWKAVPAESSGDMRRYVSTVARQAEAWLKIPQTAVILEFVYGSFQALDEYSSCLTPNRLSDLWAVIDGNFVGIGVELRGNDSGLLVVDTLEGGPAAESGIKKNDLIVSVDGFGTIGVDIDEAASKLQGKEGTSTQLIVQTPGDEFARELTLTRRYVEVKSVTKLRFESGPDGIGYLHLSAFQKTTRTELRDAVLSLKERGLKALIVDLRGNPGGLLHSAIDVSDLFIDDGVIVSTRGRARGQTRTRSAHNRNTWKFPLVLLIDGDSASASEILAGAIQEHRRGTIVGVKSYGKGSVQSILPLDTTDAGIRITTAKFFAPSGRPYSKQGVVPDVVVKHSEDSKDDNQLAAAVQACRQLLGRR